jgi:hypothetical protein
MAKDPVGPLTIQRQNILAQQAGNAIFRFAMLEEALLLLFAKCLNGQLGLAAEILAPVKNFAAQLSIIDAVVRRKVTPLKALPGWLSLYEYIVELSGDRNYIAHTPVSYHCPGLWEDATDEQIEPKIGRSGRASLLGDMKHGPLDSEEVSELILDFEEATQYVAGLMLVLDKPSLSRFSQPIARRRPPRNKRREAPKAKSPRQPRSSQE